MTELCETCRQPLCPWEGERCEECLLNERQTDEEGKADRDEARDGQTEEAQPRRCDVRRETPAGGGGVD